MEPVCSLPHTQVPATCPYPEPARASPYPHFQLVLFPPLRSYQSDSTGQKLLKIFRNKMRFYGEALLTLRRTTKMEHHPLSAVRDYLFNTSAATNRLLLWL